MKVMVLSGSARVHGNTAAMVEAFRRGAEGAGHEVDVFNVAHMKIGGCLGCEYCHTQGDGDCIQQDDMGQIYEKWNEMDVLVVASPVYYGSLTGQFKCALDRTYALGVPKNCKKTAMFLSSGAHDVYDSSTRIYEGYIQGYFRAEDLGIYTAAGSENKSERVLAELEELGASL